MYQFGALKGNTDQYTTTKNLRTVELHYKYLS